MRSDGSWQRSSMEFNNLLPFRDAYKVRMLFLSLDHELLEYKQIVKKLNEMGFETIYDLKRCSHSPDLSYEYAFVNISQEKSYLKIVDKKLWMLTKIKYGI